MRLLLDEQHDRHVAEILRSEGHDVIAVTEGQRGRSDRELLEVAVSMRRAIVSEDAADFTLLHRQYFDEGKTHYGLVLTPPGRFTRKARRRAFLAVLRTLLRAHPSKEALKDLLVWIER